MPASDAAPITGDMVKSYAFLRNQSTSRLLRNEKSKLRTQAASCACRLFTFGDVGDE